MSESGSIPPSLRPKNKIIKNKAQILDLDTSEVLSDLNATNVDENADSNLNELEECADLFFIS